MDYSKKSLVELRAIAKEKGLKRITTMKKQELINALVEFDTSSKEEGTNHKSENSSERKTAVEKDGGQMNDVLVEKSITPSPRQNMRMRGMDRTVSERNLRTQENNHRQTKEAAVTSKSIDVKPAQTRIIKQGQGRDHTSMRDSSMEYKAKNNNQRQHMNFGNTQGARQERQERSDRAEHGTSGNTDDMEQLDSGEVKSGILEVMSDGYGFIRCDNFLPGEQDVYVSPAFIRRFGLRTGDVIVGNTKVRSASEKFSALLYMKSINGYPVNVLSRRKKFEDLTPIFPNSRIHLETAGAGTAMRMVDLISPIGKGQRGMIVSQPKTGKTTLLKQVAKAVTCNHPDMHLIILLIDERPEEVTDIKESIEGENVEVIYSTFDELPENHKRVSEMVIERAKRLVEHGRDVMVLLDSITRLARAYNLTVQPSGRTLSGGLDPAALHMPKRFFGAARNMREGGSLTILATALVDTGSRMDDVVFEEFKGTGNMELVLDRSLSEKRIFPAIDLPKSSTRRDDLLLTQPEMEASLLMRRALNSSKSDEAVEQIIKMFMRTKNNAEFIEMIKKVKII
ncbi:MAG: transcription termination factor Rho [Lachnospiraceae bacterium]|nr:transcription termination factor Rho [Lachnospiraceae bacterium]